MSDGSSSLTTWRALWHDRGSGYRSTGGASALRQAIDADGFDWGPGFLDEAAHRRWAEQALELLNARTQQRILDCGCGAGAISRYVLDVATCVSMDMSEPLVRLGSRLGTIRLPAAGETGRLPFTARAFDAILCNSVFQYFPDLDYARSALHEMLRVCRPGGRVVLMDILDTRHKQEALAARAQSTRTANRRGSADLSHLYYDRSFFTDALAPFADVEFAEHRLSAAEYEHAPYRFHVIISMRPG